MAKIQAVWAIDIGQSALKAIKLVPGETPEQAVAEAFDFIEYTKKLSQPDPDPDELVRESRWRPSPPATSSRVAKLQSRFPVNQVWSNSSSCRRSKKSGFPISSSSRPSSKFRSLSTRSCGPISRLAAMKRSTKKNSPWRR